MDAIATTSRWIAAARARESARPDRLFDDPFAQALAGPEGFALLEAAGRLSAGDYLAIRTRFFDDLLLQASGWARQVVILAAGMDARAFRLDWPATTVLFEVDRPEIFDAKEPLLRQAGAQARCARRLVRGNLLGDWQGLLQTAGFRPEQPAVFLVEGLVAYLTPAQATTLFRQVGDVAAPGSCLATDIVGQSFLRSPLTQAFLASLRARGAAWTFGTDHPEALLGRLGWTATAALPGELAVAWDRAQGPAPPRGAAGVPQAYLVQATRRP